MGLEARDDFLEIAPDGVDGHFDLDVVGAHQEHDGLRFEREYVFLQAEQHAAGRVATDAAVRELHAIEGLLEIRAPALGDRIAEEDDRALVLGDFRRPLRTNRVPPLHVAVVTAQRTFARQRGLSFGRRERVMRRVGGQRRQGE